MAWYAYLTVHGAHSKWKWSSLSPCSGDFGVNRACACHYFVIWNASWWNLVCPPFVVITAAHLSGTVLIYFTNIIPCKVMKTKAFFCTIDLSSLFPNSLKSARWGWDPVFEGAVHHFQCSSRFFLSQVFTAIVHFMGIAMSNSTKTTERS